jgi:hypothetical protein
VKIALFITKALFSRGRADNFNIVNPYALEVTTFRVGRA